MKGKILFIEDELPEKSERSSIWTLLLERGFSVSVARTGQQANACLKNEQYDLVLMDIMLPPSNVCDNERGELAKVKRLDMGIFLLEQIRAGTFAEYGTKEDVLVVVISAVPGIERWEKIGRLVGNDELCLEKPCSPEDQLHAVILAFEKLNMHTTR